MKKDEPTWYSARWTQWRKSPVFFKNIFIYSSFFIAFILAFSIVLYRQVNKKSETHWLFQKPPATPKVVPAPEAVPSKSDVVLENNRLASLEQDITKLESILQVSHHLIAFELLQEVLEGSIPLEKLILYLQKNPEPWATNIMNTLSAIKESKTYPQLQALLILPQSSQSHPFWKGIKIMIKSLVSIQKLDKEGQPMLGKLEDVHVALRAHNIRQALRAFDKLPSKEQEQLTSWKQEALDRLALETLKKNLLLELSGN